MKNFHLIAFFVINFIITSNAQTSPTCLVKYKEYKRPHTGTWNYWYSNDNQISKRESNYRTMYMRGFPVLLNEGMTTQTDTIKYNKEFNEFVSEVIENNKKTPEIIFKMNSNSNVKMMTYYDDYLKKDYVVLDTLNKTENWEILSDTATILGFKCQQATINFNNDKWYAWFTTQLPYNSGPEGFSGLPGLILKVSNVSAKIGYEAVEIKMPFKGLMPTFKNSGEFISKKQYIAIAESRNKKMYDSMNSMMENLKKQGAVIKQ